MSYLILYTRYVDISECTLIVILRRRFEDCIFCDRQIYNSIRQLTPSFSKTYTCLHHPYEIIEVTIWLLTVMYLYPPFTNRTFNQKNDQYIPVYLVSVNS